MDFFILKVRNKFALNVANKEVKKIYFFKFILSLLLKYARKFIEIN